MPTEIKVTTYCWLHHDQELDCTVDGDVSGLIIWTDPCPRCLEEARLEIEKEG